MVAIIECQACAYGMHDQHTEIIQAVPEGMMGGAKCPCKGECQPRVRPCPCCYGAGCSECSQTGQRVTTILDAGGGITARVSGNAPLSADSADALASVMRAAYDTLMARE